MFPDKCTFVDEPNVWPSNVLRLPGSEDQLELKPLGGKEAAGHKRVAGIEAGLKGLPLRVESE